MEGPFADWARLFAETEAGRAALRDWEAWAKTVSGGGEEAFRALTDPRRFLFPGAPGLGAEVERLTGAPVFPPPGAPPPPDAAWGELRDAFAVWAALVSAAWSRAAVRFAARLAEEPEIWSRGARMVAECWFDLAGEELETLIRDPAYIEAQRRLIRAEAEARIAAAPAP